MFNAEKNFRMRHYETELGFVERHLKYRFQAVEERGERRERERERREREKEREKERRESGRASTQERGTPEITCLGSS